MIIAGQGTIGLEIHDQLPDVDVVIVPIGGGGLISGVALAIKEMNPNIRVIGVQAEGAASMYTSRNEHHIVALPTVNTIADGIAVKRPGDLTFDLVQQYVDEIVTVSDTEIAHTAYLLLQRAKILAEPSGVTSMAAALFKKTDIKGKKCSSSHQWRKYQYADLGTNCRKRNGRRRSAFNHSGNYSRPVR